MSKSIYSRVAFILLILLSVSMLIAAERSVSFSTSSNQLLLFNNSATGFDIEFNTGEYKLNEVSTKIGSFDQITIEGYGFTTAVGEPKLPMMRKFVAVPIGANVRFNISHQQQIDISRTDSRLRHRIIPAQEPVSKKDDPNLLPFIIKNENYNRDAYTTHPLFSVSEIGMMRGVRVFAVDFHPVSYNPQSGSLRITDKLVANVSFENADFNATEELLAKTASPEFEALYAKTILNWRNDRPSLVRTPTKMLILTPANYVSTLQPFITWKRQQGLQVDVTTVGTGGTVANTTAAIITYMQGVWSAATVQNPAPTYLLIVGDTNTTGDNIIANTGATASAHVTDLTYVRLQGTDFLPEMYYGRFSVSSATELTNIINKTLQFQKTTMPDLSYLGKVVLIAGVDATYAPTHGNGAINYGTTHYFNATNGITSNTYLYPASGSSSAAIIANANEGRGYMNYTAHGSETAWADPSFTVTNVNNMTNTDKYFVAVGNCCITNKFNYSGGPCFGEAIIRAANKGGVAYIGGTNNTYWDEDYWWAIGYKTPVQATAHAYNASRLGAYDAMFHTHSEAVADWAQTLGETVYMGNMAVEASTTSRKNYYWEIYSIMGDPSLMPYYGVPAVNNATYPSQILIGASSITVTGAPQSRVALSMNGTLYGTGIIGSGGSLNLTITPFTNVGTAQIVITRSNYRTVMADVQVIPNSGAYVSVSSATYSDTNNNNAEYNETGRFTVAFQNVGSAAASNVTATLTSSTPGITITDNSESIASIAAGATVTRTNAFTFNIANNIANATNAAFTITMVSGTSTWTHNFSLEIDAPALAFGNMIIQDTAGNNNGRLDPGETATIIMPLANSGGAASLAGNATLTSPTAGITINSGTASFSSINAGANANLSFSVSASAGMSVGTVASLVFNASSGAYTANKTETTAVGLILEDFESGNFNSFPWIMGGSLPWTIVNVEPYAGTYSAKSGAITHSQSSTMETTRVLTSAGDLSFWYKVSSETNYDFLRFYVDGTQVAQWSGTVAWTQFTHPLTAGTRVLKWEYYKDGSVSSGSDCVWLDNIIFPASTAASMLYPPQNLSATVSHQVVNLTWQAPASGTPTGYKIFKNSALLTTVTTLNYSDTAVVNGTSYSYNVKAVYSGGDSDASNTVNATPNALAPTNLIAVAGNATVNLSWTAAGGRSIEEELSLFGKESDRAISGYRIYRNSSALTTVTGTSYQDNAVVNGTTYTYHVTTIYANPAGESAASNSVQATPSAQTALEAVIGSGTGATANTAASPINVFYKSLHGQSVYTAAELNAAGIVGPINITQLGFNITNLPTVAMPNFVVRMKHTTATNVASWIDNSGLQTVYTNASYLPTATGYNMYSLSTPFIWNGVDNILVDTAFGLFTATYASTGQVQFSTVTNGYRSTRSDTADQTNVFTGGSAITSRPNVKMVFAQVTADPQFSISPTSHSFGTVVLGNNATQQFTITNTGGGSLTVNNISISAGTHFTLQNLPTLPITLGAGISASFNVRFAPSTAGEHSATVTITDNLSTRAIRTVQVSGTGQNTQVTTFPWTVNFGTTTGDAFPPLNWTKHSGVLASPSVLGANPSGSWLQDDWINITTPANKAAKINIYGTANGWLITPPIVLPNGNYEVNFDVAYMLWNGQGTAPGLTGSDDIFAVLVGDGTSWAPANVIRQWDNAGSPYVLNNITPTGMNVSLPLGTAGTKYIAFYGISTVSNADNDLMVDNVTVRQIPAAPIVTITPSSLSFGLVMQNMPTAWQNVMISNTGGSTLNISASDISIIGTDASMFTFDPASLPFALTAGQSGLIPVRFTATSAGAKTATLRIVNNQARANYDVALSGSGLPTGTVIIGDGTVAMNANPINPYYGYTYSQQIYLQPEINTTGQIESLAFYWNGLAAAPTSNDWVIYMGHTTESAFADANSWIPVAQLTQVFAGEVNIPATAGWISIPLTTPFNYNNTANLVIAVDENETGYDGSAPKFLGTNTATNRAINVYSDTVNTDPLAPSAGNLITGYPNLMLILGDAPAGPMISLNPSSLSFGEVAVGTSAQLQFSIQNSGGSELSGSITTPAGYHVAALARSASRNSINFTVPAGASRNYMITFSPTAATAYNANLVISSNAENNPTANIALSGTGYTPPNISINTDLLNANIGSGDEDQQSFIITNNGSRTLDFSITMEEFTDRASLRNHSTLTRRTQDRSIAGSTLVHDSGLYQPGTTVDWTFTVTNGSTDSEWLKDISITFPAGVTVNSATDFSGGSAPMTPDTNSGAGITINWHGEDSSGWGVIQDSQSATATVNVSIAANLSGALELDYVIAGDVYGAEPHTLSDVIVIEQDAPIIEWLSCAPMSGSVPAGQNLPIDVLFSAVNIPAGSYIALLTVSSNDPINPERTVEAYLTVSESNHAPTINLPDSFSFDKNASLSVDFSAYVNDVDGDPMTLQVSGNTNVIVDIQGLMVTFTATQNWIGTETLSFTVSDGEFSSSDSVPVTVIPVNMPVWEPVVYPNNPATIYGVITIEGIPAQANDLVAAFVGEECRGIAEVVIVNRTSAYATLIVQLNAPNETIMLKVYSYATDTVYDVGQVYQPNYGDIIGGDEPEEIDGTTLISVQTPTPVILQTGSSVQISWNTISNANRYKVYASATPEGEFELVGTTSNTSWTIDNPSATMFYYIVAERFTPAR